MLILKVPHNTLQFVKSQTQIEHYLKDLKSNISGLFLYTQYHANKNKIETLNQWIISSVFPVYNFCYLCSFFIQDTATLMIIF